MNQEEIKQILPHRDNMLLIEEVHEEDGYACASYHVRGDEFFLKGHFPDYPVVPGQDGRWKAPYVHRHEQCQIPFPSRARGYLHHQVPY